MSRQVKFQSVPQVVASPSPPFPRDQKAILGAIGACVMYMIIGPVLILNNSHILKELEFKFPMFISMLGLIFTSIVSRGLVYSGFMKIDEEKVAGLSYCRNFLPVGAALALTLTFGNAVYIHLGVALIQMLKAFTPVIVLIGLVVSGLETPSKGVILSLLGIVIGTVLNCAGSTEFNLVGVLFMFLAEFFEAIRLVLTQFLLKNKKFGVIEGQYYLAPVSAACLFILFLISEASDMMKPEKLGVIMENMHFFALSGSLGLLVNLSSFLVVQTTNSVTLKILGTVRNAGLVLFQVLLGRETITGEQFFAYSITIVAFSFYNYFKLKGQ